MFLQQEFYLLWASVELFMALTHLFVFLGFRNSKLGFLRRQQNYFLLDGMIHLINTLINSRKDVGTPLYFLWIYAFIVHMYYYRSLVVNPPPRQKENGEMEKDNSDKIPRIFHWSCVEFKDNRFSILQSGKEILETSIDVAVHTAGFYLAFRQLHSMWYKLFSIILMFVLFYRQMLTLKYFLTEPKMMPTQIRRFFHGYAAATTVN